MGEVQNNQVTITFTVYNQQGDPETGVLVTDTLAPGVTMASASQQPDQSGRNLAWSLGTIQGDARASVSVIVNLPNQTSLQLDTGANTFAMLDGDAVSATTPAATLQPGNVSEPSLLASTVDADTNDPYIQEQAAALAYDPNRIFNFLHTEIGYNSYFGSVRGAHRNALVDAGNCARRRQPGRGFNAHLGHPRAICLGHALEERFSGTDSLDVPGAVSNRRLHPVGNADFRPGQRPAASR